MAAQLLFFRGFVVHRWFPWVAASKKLANTRTYFYPECGVDRFDVVERGLCAGRVFCLSAAFNGVALSLRTWVRRHFSVTVNGA